MIQQSDRKMKVLTKFPQILHKAKSSKKFELDLDSVS